MCVVRCALCGVVLGRECEVCLDLRVHGARSCTIADIHPKDGRDSVCNVVIAADTLRAMQKRNIKQCGDVRRRTS